MILARADDKAQIQVRTDTGRVRWFPLSCVDLSSQDVPALVRIIPRDARAEGPTGCRGLYIGDVGSTTVVRTLCWQRR